MTQPRSTRRSDAGNRRPLAGYAAHALPLAAATTGVATVTLNRPGAQEPADLRALRRAARPVRPPEATPTDVHAVVITGAGGNFCSGGDVHEIIGPLVQLPAPELLMFTRMTGDLVKAMRACPQPIVAAVDGVCAGAGAILAMASRPAPGHRAQQDRLPVQPRRPGRLRHGRLRHAAAHHRPGPRRRAAVHRPLAGRRRGRALGLLQPPGDARGAAGRGAARWRTSWRARPDLRQRHHQDHAAPGMGDDASTQAIEAEAQAQAICMLTQDFRRAYEAFVAKQRPVFEGT